MLTLRPAEPGDAPLILAYIQELALYEKEPGKAVATLADLDRAFFGPKPLARALMAEWDGKGAGAAIYFLAFSSCDGKAVLYLEDLFVRQEFRGYRIGKSLLQRLAGIALEEGCAHCQWVVVDWNQPSIDFYERLGAVVHREWLCCRLGGEAMAKLAEGCNDRPDPLQ